MIEPIVNKIIIGGIQNYAKNYQSSTDTTQLRVYFDENEQVRYDVCVGWQPKETVTFKQFLNKKIDLLGYEAMSTPIFKKSLLHFSENLNIDKSEISVFIFYLKAQIGLCVFKGQTQHLHTELLSTHLPVILV